MKLDQLFLALQATTKLMDSRQRINEILNLAAAGNRDEAEKAMRTFFTEFYMDGINEGLLLATEKIEEKLRAVQRTI